jgi:hypothetical protein
MGMMIRDRKCRLEKIVECLGKVNEMLTYAGLAHSGVHTVHYNVNKSTENAKPRTKVRAKKNFLFKGFNCGKYGKNIDYCDRDSELVM